MAHLSLPGFGERVTPLRAKKEKKERKSPFCRMLHCRKLKEGKKTKPPPLGREKKGKGTLLFLLRRRSKTSRKIRKGGRINSQLSLQFLGRGGGVRHSGRAKGGGKRKGPFRILVFPTDSPRGKEKFSLATWGGGKGERGEPRKLLKALFFKRGKEGSFPPKRRKRGRGSALPHSLASFSQPERREEEKEEIRSTVGKSEKGENAQTNSHLGKGSQVV